MYMNSKTTQLKLCLYNIRGFNSLKVDYIIELLKQHSILFIVEHWLSDDKLANVCGIKSTHFHLRGIGIIRNLLTFDATAQLIHPVTTSPLF